MHFCARRDSRKKNGNEKRSICTYSASVRTGRELFLSENTQLLYILNRGANKCWREIMSAILHGKREVLFFAENTLARWILERKSKLYSRGNPTEQNYFSRIYLWIHAWPKDLVNFKQFLSILKFLSKFCKNVKIWKLKMAKLWIC